MGWKHFWILYILLHWCSRFFYCYWILINNNTLNHLEIPDVGFPLILCWGTVSGSADWVKVTFATSFNSTDYLMVGTVHAKGTVHGSATSISMRLNNTSHIS